MAFNKVSLGVKAPPVGEVQVPPDAVTTVPAKDVCPTPEQSVCVGPASTKIVAAKLTIKLSLSGKQPPAPVVVNVSINGDKLVSDGLGT